VRLPTYQALDHFDEGVTHYGVPTPVSAAFAPVHGCCGFRSTTITGYLAAVLKALPMRMQPTEEQLTALGNYRDIINQHLSEIAEGIGVPSQTLKGWMQDKGEPTSEQAQKILDFLRDKVGRGPEV